MKRIFEINLVKKWLKCEGSKEELAFRLGVSMSYINKVLTGESVMPRVDIAQEMANVLGVGFDELFPIQKTEDNAA